MGVFLFFHGHAPLRTFALHILFVTYPHDVICSSTSHANFFCSSSFMSSPSVCCVWWWSFDDNDSCVWASATTFSKIRCCHANATKTPKLTQNSRVKRGPRPRMLLCGMWRHRIQRPVTHRIVLSDIHSDAPRCFQMVSEVRLLP